jgi:hypothetical protein
MDEQPGEKLSRKEWARQQRRAAYRRAKEHRANDPKQLAFKEAMKGRRREANEAAKARSRQGAEGATGTAETSCGGPTIDDDGEPSDEAGVGRAGECWL